MYKRQAQDPDQAAPHIVDIEVFSLIRRDHLAGSIDDTLACLLYTSDAADERSSVDLGGRRIIKKKKNDIEVRNWWSQTEQHNTNNKR